jgi:hypothetical protein
LIASDDSRQVAFRAGVTVHVFILSHCFTISAGHFVVKTTQRDWFSARYDCLQDGCDLAKLEDQADVDMLINNYLNKETKYWTGLTSLRWFWQFGKLSL